jgi:hypothetical protein
MTMIIPADVARPFLFFVHDSAGNPVPSLASGAFTRQLIKGGTASAWAETITEVGGGWYSAELTTANTNSVGPLALYMNATGAQQVNMLWEVQSEGLYSATANYHESLFSAALLDLADGIEVGLTLRNALRLIAATTAGKASGAGTGVETFRSAFADDADRVVATMDVSGNRVSITYTIP